MGTDVLTVKVEETPTVGELLELLAERHPPLRHRLDHVRVAINQRFAAPEDRLPAEAEIALIPPVSGG